MGDMYMFPAGKWVRGFISSGTLNTDTAIPLVDQDGNVVTLANGQRFLADCIIISNGATAANYTLYTDANGNGSYDAGEELVLASLGINGLAVFPSNEASLAGRLSDGANKGKLRVVASAASVGASVTVIGRILSN